MESILKPFYSLEVQPFDIGNTSSKMDLSRVIGHGELDEWKLFIAHFNTIPNFISEKEIDCVRANRWFANHYRDEIKDFYFKRIYRNEKNPELDDIFYFLYDDLLVDFDTNYGFVRFLFKKTPISSIEEIIQRIKRFRKTKKSPKISLLINSKSGIEANSLDIVKPKLNIRDNYNDDFFEIHQTIVKRLSKKNDKGLVLLHGKPGTGKTSYIRHLISTINKKVIFLPPNMAASITDPDLMATLIENPNSIFVIEDAENIIVDRERKGNSPVSAILNLSDGLLSDCLNIQIICSFNTDISKVDSALLRKGRLIAKYEFKELETYKAQALSNKIGYSSVIQKPLTLSEIYNQDEKEFEQGVRNCSIGFKTTVHC